MNLKSAIFETLEKFKTKDHIVIPTSKLRGNYGETLKDAQRVGAYLIRNFESQKNVPVISDLTPTCFSIVLGTWFSNKTVAPLNSTFTPSDLAEANRISKGGIVFISEFCYRKAMNFGLMPAGTYVIFDANDLIAMSPHTIHFNQLPKGPFYDKANYIREEAFNLKSIAYLLYSSGSTGKPKGILQSFGNLLAQRDSIKKYVNEENKEYFCPSLLFPTTVMSGNSFGQTTVSFYLFCTLLSGATYYSVFGLPARDVLHYIQECKPDTFFTFSNFLSHLSAAKRDDHFDLGSVKSWIFGASPISSKEMDKFIKNFPGKRVFGYGLTEAIYCIAAENGVDEKREGSCGQILPDIEIKIVGEDGSKLNPFDVGEVVVKSKMVTIGYLENSEEQAKTFQDGWLFTGDMGYLDRDNFLYLKGRKKRIIKKDGFAIYPNTIETAMNDLAVLLEVAAVGIPDPLIGEDVVVFYSAKVKLDLIVAFEKLKLTLRPHEIPKEIIYLDGLPKTATGKIDYLSLEKLYENANKANSLLKN